MQHVLKAVLVAERQVELGLLGEVAERASDAVDGVLLGAFGRGIGEEAGFESPEAPHPPDSDGFDFSTTLVEEGLENLLQLVGKDDKFGEEAVTRGVPARAMFACF